MKIFKYLVTSVLCLGFICASSCISFAQERSDIRENDKGIVSDDSFNGNDEINSLLEPRAYQLNIIKNVSVAPAYFDSTDNTWYYYSNRMVSKSYDDSVVYFPYSKSIWEGLDTTHVRVRVTFTQQYNDPVKVYIDQKDSGTVDYSSGTCYYTYYYSPKSYKASSDLQLVFKSGAYSSLNIQTYVKEWS